MEAKELRVGNFIQRNGVVWAVNNIHGASGLIHVLPNGNESLNTRSIHDFEPIQITEEWIVWFGGEYFRRDEINPIYGHDMTRLRLDISTDAWLTYERHGKRMDISSSDGSGISSPCNVKIQYVHQLQNLYFALTGEELSLEAPVQQPQDQPPPCNVEPIPGEPVE